MAVATTLRGTVTAFSGWKNSFFLQDATGAISVDRLDTAPVQVGDDVEVIGRVQPGLYANVFVSTGILILGHVPLPRAQTATYLDMKNGDLDSKLVEVTATVQASQTAEIWGHKTLLLDLRTGDAILQAYLPAIPGNNVSYLPDSRVRVTGVCGTIFNSRRQLIGTRLFVSAPSQIEVVARGQDPSLIPESPISSLLTVHGPPLDRRVHVRGTVSYEAPGELFLQQQNAAVRILNPAGEIGAVGTQAEAWGFVSSNGNSPILRSGFLRKVRSGQALTAIKINASNVIQFENGFLQTPYDGLLVHLDAKILDRLPNTGSLGWNMVADGVQFQARIETAPASWALGFESGAQVSITGVCINEINEAGGINSFHILLRTPADMQVVQAPHWTESLVLLLAAYVAVFFAGLLIYLAQQRQHVAEVNPAVERSSRRISRALTLTGAALSVAIFLGAWFKSSPPVVSLSGAALLVASSLSYLVGQEQSRLAERLRFAAGWLVILTGGFSLFAGALSNDAFVFGNRSSIEPIPQVAALSLLLLGAAGLLSTRPSVAGFGQLLAVLVVFTTWFQTLGVLYGVSPANGLVAHLIIPASSALTLLALSLAIVFATPNAGLMKTVCAPRLGGLMFRRLLPVAVFIPVGVGWLRLQLQLVGLVDTRSGLALSALSVAFLFCMLMWSGSAILNRLDRVKSRTEEALRERQRKLDLIFETGAMGDFTWDVPTGQITAHRSVWRLYGEPAREGSASAAWFTNRQHPEDLPRIAEELAKIRQERKPLDIEFRVIWPDESVHWVYCRAFPAFDENGALLRATGINLDITDRKLAESKVSESALLFRELADAMPQIVWTSDRDGVPNFHNRRWHEYTGLQPGQSWREIVSEADFTAISGKWAASIKAGEGYENEILMRRASDRTYRWHLARAVPVRNAQGQIERWFGTCTDIHDFKRATQQILALNENLERRVEERSSQLAHAETKHRLLIESVKDYAIYMLDRDGRVNSWNEGAERLTGYSAAEIIGKHYSIFYSEEERRQGEPRRHLATAVAEGSISLDSPRVRKDGRRFWASTLMSSVYDSDGQVCGFSRVVRDISEWKNATDLLIAAQKRAQDANIAKSSFLAAMSHEIRTPMNAILGMADLLSETELKPIQREYVGRFQRAGSNLLTLINDILDLSKIESGHFDLEKVDFNLQELVDRATEIALPKATLKNIRLDVEVAPNTPALLIGDPVRLQQILNNLIGNAIKFTPTGAITLRIRPHDEGRPGHLRFAVTDTGIGIPADKLSAIFEDFTQAESSTTRRFGGTGLGLGICRRLVEKMEGELTVESVFGEGSTFHFDVVLGVSEKIAAASNARMRMPLAGDAAELASLCILLADDSEDNRFLVQAYLTGKECHLSFAENGVEAVEAFRNGQFDVILMDVQMPEMDGLTATARIRELERDRRQAPTAIFALTANALVEDSQRSHDAGCDGHLAKPISKDKLISVLLGVRESISQKAAPKSGDPFLIDIPAGFEKASKAYIRKQRETLARVHNSSEAPNLDQLRTLGHNIKGTGAPYGFPQLTVLGAALENAAKAANPQQLAKEIAQLDRYLEYATHYFSEHRTG